MIGDRKILAIIPARAGSKRIKNKNIRMLAGKPLVQWTFDAVMASKYVDAIYVTTDSPEIAQLAKDNGLLCPELRPGNLASDTATTNDVLNYVVNNIEKDGQEFDFFMLLQPTSPLRKESDIDEAIEVLYKSKKQNLVSLSLCEFPPQFTNVLPENKSLAGFLNPKAIARTQDLHPYYRLNGAIYIYSRHFIGKISEVYCDDSIAYISRKGTEIDIDNYDDFAFAEYLISKGKGENVVE